MKIKLWLLVLIAVLTLIPSAAAAANTGSIKLLAMSELDSGVFKGSIADLTLEIRPGTGRVFVNTFPISKIDTQISMRFAKQIACRHAEADCSKYDFIYTLKASSSIVGGPSAGAAAAVLTSALLSSTQLKDSIAITGTINSGELIGPVGGLKAKIEAASDEGISKVLIPKGSALSKEGNETDNITISLVDYGNELGIEVIEVSTLDDAFYHFTGKEPEEQKKELVVDPEYERIMKSLAVMLCERSQFLEEMYLSEHSMLGKNKTINNSMLDIEESAANATEKAHAAFEDEDYYTSASYCFRANINYGYLLNYFRNLSIDEMENITANLEQEIDDFEDSVDSMQLRTLTDMQAYMITKQRISEAREKIESAAESMNSTADSAYWIAFANERLFSAKTWGEFFGAEGQEFMLDNETFRESCEIKLSEAEERYQYVNFYFPGTLSATKDEIDTAAKDKKKGNYIMCLYKASLAKAQASVVMSAIGVDKDMVEEIVSQKILAAEQAIIEQQEIGIFPIMGYSYFEYANSLFEDDPSSAMMYAEYALEVSNFDFYFEKKDGIKIPKIELRVALIFIFGILIGLGIGLKARKPTKQKKPRPKKKR